VRALRLSSRPPKAGTILPTEVRGALADAAGAGLAADVGADRWVAVLDATAYAPVRGDVKPISVPETPSEELVAAVKKYASRVPGVAAAFGIDAPAPARPQGRSMRPPKPARRPGQVPVPKRPAPPPGAPANPHIGDTFAPPAAPAAAPEAPSDEPAPTPEAAAPEAPAPTPEAPAPSTEDDAATAALEAAPDVDDVSDGEPA
jgi:hypothetical protein